MRREEIKSELKLRNEEVITLDTLVTYNFRHFFIDIVLLQILHRGFIYPAFSDQINFYEMKMSRLNYSKTIMFFALIWLFASGISPGQQATINYNKYHQPDEINTSLAKLAKQYGQVTRMHDLATSAGGRKLVILEIGNEVNSVDKKLPAVFIAGNMEGTVPISSEAAVYLADLILSDQSHYDGLTWYIMPCGNPDAAMHYFNRPLVMDARNDLSHNDDMDELTDEDGWNDLNGDGWITQMRVKDPEGIWIPVESDPRLMRKADYSKGEKGIYKLYDEGIDDDRDGKFYEDGPGGVNVGINFPHLFKAFTPTGGLWPGSVDESYGLMKFITDHPEIAMTFTLGSTNFCLVPPKGGRQGAVDLNKIKLPERFAKMFDADPNKSYSMSEIIEMVQPMVPEGFEVTESVVAGFLGLGAVVNPMKEDLVFYKDFSEKYKKYLKEKGAEVDRLDPEPAKDGSFEFWSYYHLGLPTFSMDFWTLPKVKEKKEEKSGLTSAQLKKMSDEEFIALDKEKISAYLKETGAPKQFNAEMIVNMVKEGQMTPAKIAEMTEKMQEDKKPEAGKPDPKMNALVAFSDAAIDGKGYVNWSPYNHPILGEVEIGGPVPFTDNTPPVDMIDSLLNLQVPWIFEIVNKLPDLKILKTELKAQGEGVYELKVWVENKSFIPIPTAMGKRNQRPAPVLILLSGKNFELLSGKKRTTVSDLPGLKNKKFTWLIKSEKNNVINIELKAVNALGDKKQIKIGGGE